MKHILLSVAGSLALLGNVSGQAFLNLDFERSIITSSSPSGMANIPGWTQSNGWGDANYPGGASVIYNNQTLDAPMVALWDSTYGNAAIQGNYSVALDGGTIYYHRAFPELPVGASIFQTGEIPITAKSISYWGSTYNGLQVTFNGQPLSFINISNAVNYTVWGADIAAYAGQTGQLTFTAPLESGGLLDNIQFSPSEIPEPSLFGLLSVGMVFLLRHMNRPNRRKASATDISCSQHDDDL